MSFSKINFQKPSHLNYPVKYFESNGIHVNTTDLKAEEIPSAALHSAFDALKIKNNKREAIHESVGAIVSNIQIPTEIFYTSVTEPYSYIEPFLRKTGNLKTLIDKVIFPFETTRTILQVVELIGCGAALIFHASHYKEAKTLLNEKKLHFQINNSAEQKILIEKLQRFLLAEWEMIKERILDFSYSFIFISLKLTNLVLETIQKVALIARNVISWSYFYLLDILSALISLWRAHQAKTTYHMWMEQVAKDQRSFQQAETLLAKRQERMILQKTKSLTMQELIKLLEENGIDFLKEKLISKEDFERELSDPIFRNKISKKCLNSEDEKLDCLNVLTRNATQVLAETKGKNEANFFNFKLVHAKISLILSCVSASSAIILEALTLAGIIVGSSTLIAIPCLIFFVLGWALAGLSLYFFYKNRPNLFKCYLRGVNLRLSLLQIPAKIRSLQLERKKEEIVKLQIKSVRYHQLQGLLNQKETLEVANYPIELQKMLRELQKKINDKIGVADKDRLQKLQNELRNKKEYLKRKLTILLKKEDGLRVKVNEWIGKEGIITKLQDQLSIAGNKDFGKTNRLLTTVKNEELNIPLLIANSSEICFDEETIKVLKKKMAIEQCESNGKLDKNKLMDQIRDFLKMDDSELLEFIKQK